MKKMDEWETEYHLKNIKKIDRQLIVIKIIYITIGILLLIYGIYINDYKSFLAFLAGIIIWLIIIKIIKIRSKR